MIAVAVVVIAVSLIVVLAAEVGRRVAEGLGCAETCELVCQTGSPSTASLRLPVQHDTRIRPSSSRERLVGQPVADHAAAPVSTWNWVNIPR